MSDLIRREDAIKAVAVAVLDDRDELEALKALPSAELVLQTPQTYGKSINPSNAEAVADYISRAELNDCIKQWYEYMGVDTHGVWNKQLAEIVKGMDEDDLALDFRTLFARISALPSTEAVQGEWVKEIHHYKDDEQEFDYYDIHCSVCGAKPQKSWKLTNYCPYCGAKMHKCGDSE